MTVSSIEVIAATSGGTGTPTITTSLVSTDRVVVLLAKVGPTGTPAVTGLGATWVIDASATTTHDHYVFSATGVTGGGALSITASAGDYIVHVLRSSVATTPYLVSAQSTTYAFAAAATVRTLTGAAAAAGSMVLGTARVSAGTIDFPRTGTTPASGWTTDWTNGTVVKSISQQISANETVALSLTSSAGHSAALLQAIYYDDDVPAGPSPLVNTFVGWGNPIF